MAKSMRAMPDFMSRTPGPCMPSIGDAAGHVGERAERIDGVEVAEEENGLGFFAAGEIDLQVVAVVFGVDAGARATEGFEGAGEKGAHAIGGGLMVAGRFDLDELADGFEERVLARFEVAEAVEESGSGCVFGERRSSWRALGLNPGDPWCCGV